MQIPKEYQRDFDSFPAVLKTLLVAEIAAGNSLAEIGHGFPAPPVGAYIKLAKPLCSRPRASGDGLDYYDRNGASHSGEITDVQRFYFLLEPPNPRQPEPGVDAIRAAIEARQGAGSAQPDITRVHPAPGHRTNPAAAEAHMLLLPKAASSTPPGPQTVMERFRASMVMDVDSWRDGTGYDLALLDTATPDERAQIEDLLVSGGVNDWRDVEALAALGTPRARALLLTVLKSGERALAVAVTAHAPHVVSTDDRTAALVAALEGTDTYGGLTQVLLEVESFHPPEVIQALLRGVLARRGEDAMHFAAMLMFIHGKADTSFDWDQRPFFLKFNTEDRTERESMFRTLCRRIGLATDDLLSATHLQRNIKQQRRRGQ